ncbi:hypothetical protein [Clostridium magnum]|uniref:hypothetical protein n=1 Tax=Clostridium magnum TaxID=33954 RepID=UPI00091B1076|nr:hypothetical protein [Clostridium magnum]SHI52094.1 hypothetical protein SAMN02745944_04441 [Clostridium magnum DSM 2767]
MLFFDAEPIGNVYGEIIDTASSICNQFILVERHSISLNDNAIKVLKELNPFLLEKREQQEWLGTELFGDTATVNYYSLNEKSKHILKTHAKGLYSWVQPNLTEDLSFIKDSGEAWLINIAHEYCSYIDSDDDDELMRIKSISGINARYV